jgi:Family of unknown function (DUF5519)
VPLKRHAGRNGGERRRARATADHGKPVHDLLLAEGPAEQHRWVPSSGWITFHIRSERDITHALWRIRLFVPALRAQGGNRPRRLFDKESEGLRLNPRFKSLLEPFVPENTRAASTVPLPAKEHAKD